MCVRARVCVRACVQVTVSASVFMFQCVSFILLCMTKYV